MITITIFALAGCAMTARTGLLSPDTTAASVEDAPSLPASDSAKELFRVVWLLCCF